MEYQLLPFDTQLFGFKIAKLLPQNFTTNQLSTTLNRLQLQGIRLVYGQVDPTDKIANLAAQQLNGYLCSQQLTFEIVLSKLAPLPPSSPRVAAYRGKKPTTEMKNLAFNIGKLSRFGTDPKMPKELMLKMYSAWITNSVNQTIADRVLVIKEQDKIIAMLTFSHKKPRGKIGLVAVDPKHRGKNLATQLVQSAFNYLIINGSYQIQVITQKANLPACNLYQKLGFTQKQAVNFYHFWLDKFDQRI